MEWSGYGVEWITFGVLVLQHPRLGGVIGAFVPEARCVGARFLVKHHARLLLLGDALQFGELLPLGQRLRLGHLLDTHAPISTGERSFQNETECNAKHLSGIDQCADR